MAEIDTLAQCKPDDQLPAIGIDEVMELLPHRPPMLMIDRIDEISRKGEGGPTIDKQTVMAELRWVAARLADFYEPDEVRLWLQSPHPQLSGARPYDLINDGRAGEVLEVIERLDSGVYL